MAFPNTDSIIGAEDGRNATRTGLSTNIIIEVDGNAVGAIRQMSITEQRNIVTVDEVGTDGHIDSAPQRSTDITCSCERTRFDNLRIAAAFARGFVHASAQRIPFDIVIKDTFAGPDISRHITTVIKNCWISRIQVTYRADDFVIAESMDLTAETIFSTLATGRGNVVPAIGNARDLDLKTLDSFEQATDRGERRGALDGFGLLDAVGAALTIE